MFPGRLTCGPKHQAAAAFEPEEFLLGFVIGGKPYVSIKELRQIFFALAGYWAATAMRAVAPAA